MSAHIHVLHTILVIVGVRPGKIEANTISLVNATAQASATVASALNGGLGLGVIDGFPIRRFAFVALVALLDRWMAVRRSGGVMTDE